MWDRHAGQQINGEWFPITLLVASIRDDCTFSDFRLNLLKVYGDIPAAVQTNDWLRTLAQSEETHLRPVIERAEREARHGVLYRLGIGLAESAISVGARVAYDAQTGQFGWGTVAREAIGTIADRVRFEGSRNPISVWTKLYRHNRTLGQEIRGVRQQAASPPSEDAWAIDAEPSLKVRITSGVMLFDEPPLDGSVDAAGYTAGDYRPCECESGRKYKFCCKGLR